MSTSLSFPLYPSLSHTFHWVHQCFNENVCYNMQMIQPDQLNDLSIHTELVTNVIKASETRSSV